MSKLIGLLLCTVSVTTVNCQQVPNAGNCTIVDVGHYLASNVDLACASNLNTALYANISSPGKDSEIRTVCTGTCAGRLANWLEGACGGTFNATSLYYLCLRTSGTASVGAYCQYTIPPVYNADLEILNVFQACENVLGGGPCTDQCELQLNRFSSQLGCCYQSLYNNTAFVRGAVQFGELAMADEDQLRSLGNLQLWNSCQVTPPSACTDESFGFPTGELPTSPNGTIGVIQLQLLGLITLAAIAIIFSL